MSRANRTTFRPEAEGIEDRVLTTGGLMGLHAPHPAIVHHGITAQGGGHHHHAPQPPPPDRPGGGIGPGLGAGLVRLALPGNYLDYGVVTIWNNTPTQASFSVGASTFNNGQLYPFLLNPGQFKSFYAPKIGPELPLFAVSFGNGSPLIPLPQDNLVFEAKSYVPAGTAGWPYAINLGVNGYYMSYI